MTPVECLGDDLVLRFAQGQLPEATSTEVQEHVSECDDCRHLVAEAARYFSDNPESIGSAPTRMAAVPLDSSERPEPPTEPRQQDGHRVGRYQLQEVIGAGGMGVVYTAFDPQLNRKVALKLVRASSANADLAQKSRARLLREAQAMAQLQHPNVVTVFDAGTHEGQVFVAMEWVQGETLKSWLKARQLTWRGVVETFIAAGEGLAAAHAAGLVHRDFKPENVLISQDGRVRVTDFGLARLETMADAEEGKPLLRLPSGRPGSMTETGMLLGTPAYMAPEQLQGQLVDARSDQFSFCVALFEALYGRRPYRLTSVTNEPLAFPKGAPASVVKVLARGLDPVPAARFASMRELISDLKAAAKVEPKGRAPVVVGAAVAVLALMAIVARFAVPHEVAPSVTPPAVAPPAEVAAPAQRPPDAPKAAAVLIAEPRVAEPAVPAAPPRPEAPPVAVRSQPTRAASRASRAKPTASKPAAAASRSKPEGSATAGADSDDAVMTNPWGSPP